MQSLRSGRPRHHASSVRLPDCSWGRWFEQGRRCTLEHQHKPLSSARHTSSLQAATNIYLVKILHWLCLRHGFSISLKSPKRGWGTQQQTIRAPPLNRFWSVVGDADHQIAVDGQPKPGAADSDNRIHCHHCGRMGHVPRGSVGGWQAQLGRGRHVQPGTATCWAASLEHRGTWPWPEHLKVPAVSCSTGGYAA